MIIEVLLTCIVIVLLYQRWLRRDVLKLGRELNSGVIALPFVGHSYLFLGNNHRRMKAFQILGSDAIRKDNGLTSLWHGSYLYTMIADPEAAVLALKTCLEKDDIMEMAKLFIGNGSIFAPVPVWRPRRKVLIPSFSSKNLKYFLHIFIKQSAILVQQMKKVAETGPIPAWNYFTAYTMDTTSEATIGYEMNAQAGSEHPFLKAFEEGLAKVAERLCQPWLHNDLIYTNLPVYKKLLKEKCYLWDFIARLIKLKRQELKEDNEKQECDSISAADTLKTFMELLIKASGGNEGYTDVEVIEETMVIMVPGNDTSAVGASFVAVMLSRHLDVQEKVYEELQEVFGCSNTAVTIEDLSRLKYLDAVIKETLRLYPPVPVITRKVEKEVILPTGIKLVPGTGVIVNIWALHRNPRYWGEDAEEFRPERFMDAPLRHPAAFMPFSHGPRNCVGYQFAMTSMKTVMSSVLRHYKILPATSPDSNSKHPPLRLKFDLMMKDEDNFQIIIESRENKTTM